MPTLKNGSFMLHCEWNNKHRRNKYGIDASNIPGKDVYGESGIYGFKSHAL